MLGHSNSRGLDSQGGDTNKTIFVLKGEAPKLSRYRSFEQNKRQSPKRNPIQTPH